MVLVRSEARIVQAMGQKFTFGSTPLTFYSKSIKLIKMEIYAYFLINLNFFFRGFHKIKFDYGLCKRGVMEQSDQQC